MVAYYLTYFSNALSFIVNDKYKKYINIFVLLALVFMSGTRYYMGGNDVYVYENVYNSVPSIYSILTYVFTGVNSGVNTNYEIGFLLVCSISKALHFSYFGFILMHSAIFYSLLYFGVRDFVSEWAPFIALFMYKLMFYNTFISIRQGLTLAIFAFSLRYIRDKRIVSYLICCFIAFLIHRGALILFPLFLVAYIPVSKRLVKLTAGLFLPTIIIRERINIGPLIERIIDYVGYRRKSEGWADASEPISIIHTIECYVVIALILLFWDKIIDTAKANKSEFIINLFILIIPILTLFSNWIVMTREKDYFVLTYGIIFSYLISEGTTNPTYDNYEYSVRDIMVGNRNMKVLSLMIITTCLIGMTRFVFAFDNGVLKKFVSFIYMGVSIFE